MKYTQDWKISAVTQIKSAPCLPGSGNGHFPVGTAAIADTAGGVQFEYENKKYTKCRIICCGFVYMDFVQDDIDSLMSLVKAECLSMQTNRHVSHRMTCDFHRNTKKA